MKIKTRTLSMGERSVLMGAHQFIIHPLCVALAWRKLYGTRLFSLPLFVCFFVHDLGYFVNRCEEMDSEEGERHVEWGAALMGRLFGEEWASFTIRHSRFYCRKYGFQPSALCYADKLATFMLPRWLYFFMIQTSGEVDEYIDLAFSTTSKYSGEGYNDYDAIKGVKRLSRKSKMTSWYETMKKSLTNFVENGAHQVYILEELSSIYGKRRKS